MIIDMQKDFCPGGALPVTQCNQVIRVLNRWIEAAERAGSLIVFSRDWHPPNHTSFESHGGPWPQHCVRDTAGAEFCDELQVPTQAAIVSKGESPDFDQYSPFAVRELGELLHGNQISRLWIGGVARDVCVKATVLDALKENYEVHLIVNATAPVDESDGRAALNEMQAAGAILESEHAASDNVPSESMQEAALFTDLYELTMLQSYLRENMSGTAVFELFFRELPDHRNFLMAAGLDPLLTALENFRFTRQQLNYLQQQELFSKEFLDQLADMEFTGDIWAVPEGTVVFPSEPLVQVIAPLPQAQLVETLVLNQIHFATVAAGKAARLVLAADGRRVIDFGSRRASGRDAANIVARAAYLAGCDGTSLVEAGYRYGIPIVGTMAHSYIQAHDNESAAFRDFLESFPEATLLVDTYDTLDGVRKVIELSRELGPEFSARAIRLDSGNLPQLARESRERLDEAGLKGVRIVASGGLDEDKLQQFRQADAPFDGYGIGTALAVSDDAPALDMAYKLVEYDGQLRTKLSSSKTIYPGRKQVFRVQDNQQFTHDVLAPFHSDRQGVPLLREVMRDGRRIESNLPSLQESRDHARQQLSQLPARLRQLEKPELPYRIDVDPELEAELQRLKQKYHDREGGTR